MFPVELTIVPVRTDRGEMFTATLRDITERRRIETALRDSEEQLRVTFEQAAVGMLRQASDRQVLQVNQALCDMLGCSRDELLQTPFNQRIHPDDVAPGRVLMDQAFAGEIKSFVQEKRYRRSDGHYFWVRLTASIARDADGKAQYMICVIENIEAQRRAEDERNALLERVLEARRNELAIGARIQQTLLVEPPDQRLPGVWLSTFSQASQGVDGDFIEIIPLGEHCVDIVVGDVMGKGVGAALMGAGTKMQFSRSIAELMARPAHEGLLPQPAEIMAAVHRAMTPSLQSLEAFVTLSYVRIDDRAGSVTWVGCGHEEPLLLRADGGQQVLANQHPPLGVLDDEHYRQDTLALSQQDALFLCSDGAVDALLPDGQRVGRARIDQMLGRLLGPHRTPAAVLHALRSDLQTLGATFTDDLTMALAVRTGPAHLASRRELPARLASLAEVRGLVEFRARQSGLDEAAGGLFTVACVEAFSNIIRHTLGRPNSAPIELLVLRRPDALVVELVSLGQPFSPPTETPPDTDWGEYPEGGFGMNIMYSATDGVVYEHHQGINTVRLVRRLA